MSRKILLIEDNEDVRENTAEILELADFEVVTAENGKIGVQKAKEEAPDLIICDIMMPELDGYGVLHILSRNPETSTTPFIFLTAKAEKSDMRKGMNLGADDYLTKPFEETELMDAIESRLKRSDSLRTQFDQDGDGLSKFINEAKALAKLEQIATERSPRDFFKKESIYREGDFPSGIYLVNSGSIKVSKINDDGKELVTGLYKKGDYFGITAVLNEETYTENAVALEDSTLCKLNKQEFLELLYTDRDVANRFIKILSNNLVEKEKELIDLAYNTVRKRVADALLKLSQNTGTDDGKISISRMDIANLAGTAQESAIRFLSEFKSEGVIEIKGRSISIVDPVKLENMRY